MNNSVESLLLEKGITYSNSGKDYTVRCLNPDHDDSNPSMRIDKVKGIFNCYSCGFTGNIFRHFNKLIPNSIKTAELKAKLLELSPDREVLLPKSYARYTKEFRGISRETIMYFNAFTALDDQELKDRVFFPIYDINDKLCSYIGRHVDKNAEPKYLVRPHNKPISLWPQKLITKSSSIILVEGILDYLSMFDAGVKNVVCCFGVSSLRKKAKEKLLPFKVQGITKIFILFDGDGPGREEAKNTKSIIEKVGFECEIINLDDDEDPNSLTMTRRIEIGRYVNENSSN